MTSKIPKISVIIPVYNAEQYLKRCLDSVCHQTLKDIEIICIDDCSSDGSPQILQEYSKNHVNLAILRLEKNQGESGARNAGLYLAKGEYLAFIDNDDEIDPDFYEKLYDKAKEKDTDIVKGQAIEIEYSGKKHVIKQLQEGDDSKWFFLTYWWTAIYKRSLIIENNISFSAHHSLGGDLLFLNQVVIAAKNLQIVNDVYYNYYRREDSGDSKILSEEKIRSALSIYETVIDNVNAKLSANSLAYNFIFHHFLMACFYLSLRNDEKEMKKTCAKTTMDIFEKCQNGDGLRIIFAKTAPHLFLLLKNKDKNGVEEVLIKCKSRMELIVSGLRARITK
ncbi:MAG: glycoslytransferase [Rickettsiaceae bacterium]|jgi:glycosyltransferase involved in cell wall biosynthesis|nr:glycoslytransferase [Rickettsiaceae bacterium]